MEPTRTRHAPRRKDGRGRRRLTDRRLGLLIRRARRIATRLHAKQVDLQGQPYIGHLTRVAKAVPREARPAAWLHDVLEDTQESGSALRAAGIPYSVLQTVWHLTRFNPESWGEYIHQIARSGDRHAVLIKQADLRDNLRPGNPAAVARYERALSELQRVK